MDPLTKLLICLMVLAAYIGLVLLVARFVGFNDENE